MQRASLIKIDQIYTDTIRNSDRLLLRLNARILVSSLAIAEHETIVCLLKKGAAPFSGQVVVGRRGRAEPPRRLCVP